MDIANLVVGILALGVGIFVAIVTFRLSRQGQPHCWRDQTTPVDGSDTKIYLLVRHGLQSLITINKIQKPRQKLEHYDNQASRLEAGRVAKIRVDVPAEFAESATFKIKRRKEDEYTLVVSW
jgi:hypothetical protein